MNSMLTYKDAINETSIDIDESNRRILDGNQEGRSQICTQQLQEI